MAVGQPETNLNTWGLRYVKKKEVENKSPAETKPDQFMRDDEAATSNPRTRQQDKVPDTTGIHAASGKKVGEQVHQHQQDKTRLGGQKGETFTTSGSPRGEGATDTATRAGQALDAKGQVKHEQTHTGSEGRNLGDPSTDPKSRGGHKIKPAKQGESLSPSAKPSKNIQRAALDLAIIKCKLLKMSDIKKDFIEDNKPTRPQFRKDDDDDKKDSKKGDSDIGHGVPKPDDGTPQGKAESDKEIKDKKLDHVYRSEDIVEKAIELINEAYDEMKSEGFKKLKPTYEGDTKEAKKGDEYGGEDLENYTDEEIEGMDAKKKDAPASTSTVGAANFVYSDVHEKKKVRSQAQAEADKKEAEESDKDSKPSKPVKPKKGQKYDTDEYPAWHDRDTFY